MPVYQISQPKMLSQNEWEGLHGTPLYETMVRNRIRIEIDNGNSKEVEAAAEAVLKWLEEHVSKFYYCEESDDHGLIYFEDAAEMVAFTLAHAGEESPTVEDVGRPVKPHRSGGGIIPPPTPNPPHRSGPSKIWPHVAPADDQWWRCDENDDVWKPLRAVYGDETCTRALDILRGDLKAMGQK